MEGSFVEPTGGTESGKFTVAMTGRGIRRKAERFQYPQGAKADRTDGGLSDIRGAQGCLHCFPLSVTERGRRVDQVGQAAAGSRTKLPVRSVKTCQHGGETTGEIAQHPGVLGPLAGKQHADLARCGAGCIPCAVRRIPGSGRLFAEHGQRIIAERFQFSFALFNDQSQSAGSVHIKG